MFKKVSAKSLCRAGVIAALYVVMSLLLYPLTFGTIQFRLSEALTVLPLFFCGKRPRAFYRLSYSQPVQRGGDLRYSDRFGGNASRRNLHLSCGQSDKKQDLKISCRNNFSRGFQRFCRASYFRPCWNERICLHARSCDNRRRRTRRGCGFRRNFIFRLGKNFRRKG